MRANKNQQCCVLKHKSVAFAYTKGKQPDEDFTTSLEKC